MKAEGIIRRQAKALLSQDNWCKAVAAFIFLICTWLVSNTVLQVSYFINDGDLNALAVNPQAHTGDGASLFLLELLSLMVLLAFSPVFIGYIKWNDALAKGQDTDFSVLFPVLTIEEATKSLFYFVYIWCCGIYFGGLSARFRPRLSYLF